VEAPIAAFPFIVILEAAVKVTEVPALIVLVRLPAMINAVAGIVLTTAPVELLKVRFP